MSLEAGFGIKSLMWLPGYLLCLVFMIRDMSSQHLVSVAMSTALPPCFPTTVDLSK